MGKTREPSLSTFLVAVILASPCMADAIRVNGTDYQDVVIRESEHRYYIQLPDTGTAFTIAKESIPPEDVRIAIDPERRDRRHAKWLEKNAERRGTPRETAQATSPRVRTAPPELGVSAKPPVDPAPIASVGAHGSPEERATRPEGTYVTDGHVSHIRLEDVPLHTALTAALRPLHLDYRVEGNLIWVSTPERLRSEPGATMDTRLYRPQSPLGADVLPKVIVSNSGGPQGSWTSP